MCWRGQSMLVGVDGEVSRQGTAQWPEGPTVVSLDSAWTVELSTSGHITPQYWTWKEHSVCFVYTVVCSSYYSDLSPDVAMIWDDTSSDVTQYYSMGTVKGWENEKYLSSKISTIEIQSEWNVQYLPGNMLLCSLRLLTSNWGNCPLLLWRGESGTKRSIKWSIMTLIIKLLHYIATHSQLYANFRGGRNSGWPLLW